MIKCRINGLELEFDNVDDLLEYQRKVRQDKSNVQTEQEKEQPEQTELQEEKVIRRKFRAKRLPMKERHERFEKIRALMGQGITRTKAVKTVFGYHDTAIHRKFKMWLYRKYKEIPKALNRPKKVAPSMKSKLNESHMEKIRVLNRSGMSVKDASMSAYGKRLTGVYYYRYKDWLDNKYSEEPIFHHNIRNAMKGRKKPILASDGQAVVKNPKPKKTHYMARNHGAFLGFRNKTVKAVMKSMNLPYKEALKYLGTVYKRHTKEEDAIKEVERETKAVMPSALRNMPFPEIAYVDKDNEELLISMLENVIKLPTASLSRRIEGEILGITATWGAFVESFMVKSFKIAEYFGVENRFRLSDTKSISYHK